MPSPIDQRTRILAAAERLVTVRGFDQVRLRDVAQEAGVSIGTLQHYFETRDGLLRETFLWSAENGVRRWAAAPDADAPPWDRLAALVEHAFADPDRFRIGASLWTEFTAVASRDEAVREVMADLYQQWRAPLRAVIEDGVAAGAFRLSTSVADTVDILAAQLDGLGIAGIVAADGMHRERLLALMLATARMAVGRP